MSVKETFNLPTCKIQIKNLFEEAFAIADSIFVDELNCKKSFCRVRSDKTKEEALKICLYEQSFYTFIYRDFSWQGEDHQENYYELGASTCSRNLEADIFIFVNLSEKNVKQLIKKYCTKKCKPDHS